MSGAERERVVAETLAAHVSPYRSGGRGRCGCGAEFENSDGRGLTDNFRAHQAEAVVAALASAGPETKDG